MYKEIRQFYNLHFDIYIFVKDYQVITCCLVYYFIVYYSTRGSLNLTRYVRNARKCSCDIQIHNSDLRNHRNHARTDAKGKKTKKQKGYAMHVMRIMYACEIQKQKRQCIFTYAPP